LSRPALGTVLLAVMFGAVVLRASTVLGLDTDYVLHLVYGRAILSAGSPWLAEDPTIYTGAGAPVLHEWLAEALFAGLDRMSGAWGPVRLAALIGALVPWLLFRQALAHTRSFWPALAAWVTAAAGIATGLLVRPHLFSVAAFLAAYGLLDRWRTAGDWRRVAPWLAVTVLLWTNLHGGGAVLLLPLLLAGFAACNWRQAGARLLPLAYLLTLANPWGPRLHQHTLAFLRSAAPRMAADMGPPDLQTGTLYVLLFLVAILLATAIRRFRPASGTTLAICGATLLAACLSMRNLPFLGIALTALVPAVLESWLAEHPPAAQRSLALAAEEPTRPLAAWALVVLALVPPGPLLPQPAPAGARVPVAAIDWLGEHREVARQRGYAGYDDAGFLLHAGVVDRVYLHSLNATTPLGLADEQLVFQQEGPGWRALFDRRSVSWALVRPEEPLAAGLAAAGWRPAWRDEGRVVYLRP
jgi:hypothetical protein